MAAMIDSALLDHLDAQQLRALAAELAEQIARNEQQLAAQDSALSLKDQQLLASRTQIEQLSHEIAVLKRWKFARHSEQMNAEQRALFDEDTDADLEAIECEFEQLAPKPEPAAVKDKPRRTPLPAQLPRVEIRHEPDLTQCRCGCALKRIGEDVSERLDYTPGVFTVQRHIRGKWVCASCETLTMAPVPAQVIDKGIPTAGLLAQVLVAKYADHAPLYR